MHLIIRLQPLKSTKLYIYIYIYIVGNDGITIPKNKDINIDLNGWTVIGLFNEDRAGHVFVNNGKLTITDTSAEQEGKLTDNGLTADEAGNWYVDPKRNYADNVISNYGDLVLNSGSIVQGINGNIVYCVDNYSGGTFTMNGGYLNNWNTACVRMFCNSTTVDNIVNITGGELEGYQCIWVQNPSGTKNAVGGIKNKGTLNISGGEFTVLGSGTDTIYSYEAYYGDKPDYQDVYYDCSAINILITGGTFNGNINIYECASDSTKNVNYSINNATVNKFLRVWLFDNYADVSALPGKDYVVDCGTDLTGVQVYACYYGGTEEMIPDENIHIDGSVITIDGEALHEFTNDNWCIYIYNGSE